MKKETRFIGFNEGSFNKDNDKTTLLVGTIYLGGEELIGVVSSQIEIDGDDATDAIIKMVNDSHFKCQLKCILLGSITMGGLNVIDIQRVYEETGIPVMSVIKRKPRINKFKEVLVNLKMDHKIAYIERAGDTYEDYGIFFQTKGLTKEECTEILNITMTRADYPEPLRISRMIANAIVHT